MSRQRQTPRRSKKETPRKIKPLAELTIIHPHAAGLDIGSRGDLGVCARVEQSRAGAGFRSFHA